ncbi:hypothetical protein PS15p_211029 [Mucor circinelloides]
MASRAFPHLLRFHNALNDSNSLPLPLKDLVVENARLRAELDVVKTTLTDAQHGQLSTSLAATAQPPHPTQDSPPKPKNPPSAATTIPAPMKQRRKKPVL